ncbi:hypothetical protein QQ045_018194 [Rhodiola kirilowii]
MSTTTMTLEESSSVPTKSPSVATGLSTQHSPVTYLICGIAAMSLLIGSALLIFIISYWQYKARLDQAESERRRDLEVGEGEQGNFGAGERKVGYREKIAVIMAGDENPRFLATPKRYKRFLYTDDEAEKQSVDGERGKERISNETASHQDV